jgi:hypothetical protein
VNPGRCSLALALVAFCSLAAGPEDAGAEVGRPHGRAMQFSIQSSFAVRDFGALTVAYQRFLGDDVALRLGLTLDLSHQAGDYGELYITQEEGEIYDESIEHGEWDHTGHVSCEWIRYTGERLSLYYGGGPRIFYSSHRDEDSSFYEGFARHSRRDQEEYGGGLQGCLGIQWAFCDWLAVHAEYQVFCTYSHSTETYQRLQTGDGANFTEEKYTSDTVTLDSRGVRMGLSAYF